MATSQGQNFLVTSLSCLVYITSQEVGTTLYPQLEHDSSYVHRFLQKKSQQQLQKIHA